MLVWSIWGGATPAARGQWSEVAPGISYREDTLDGPVRVYVARADRRRSNWTIDTMTSLGEIKGGHETVPDMARRYDDTITFDGHRYDLKIAINGDYCHPASGVALGGQIMSGWFCKRFGDYAGNSGFVWTTDRRCFIGGNVLNGPKLQYVLFEDGARMRLDQLNTPRGENQLALYTPQYTDNTGTTPDGVEVVVQVEAPIGIIPDPPGSPGIIQTIRRGAGATPILFDRVVLSAHGAASVELLKHVREGRKLHVVLQLEDHGSEGIGLPPGDWRRAWASIAGPKCILTGGKVPRDWEAKAARYAAEGKRHGSVVKDPRTGIAYNDRHVFFFVVDGRWQSSIGMTFTEAGNFCRDVLGATDATLQDGGGSSTMWVDGAVRNHISGKPGQDEPGKLRPVANGCFIAEVMPPRRSDRYRAGQTVQLTASAPLRTGPGAAGHVTADPPADRTAQILPHRLNGILAKGTNWWFVAIGENRGWLAAEDLGPQAGP